MREIDFKSDKRASKYDEGFEGRFSRRFYTALLSQVKLEKGFAVLDVGCGTGHLLRAMADRQEITGFGIDVEPNMIEMAKQKCPDRTIEVSACERASFDDGAFDILTACMAYHHFPTSRASHGKRRACWGLVDICISPIRAFPCLFGRCSMEYLAL